MADPIPFSGDPLWRASNERRDADWVARHLAAPGSRFLPFWKNNPLTTPTGGAMAQVPSVVSGGDPCELVWLDNGILKHLAERDKPALLGLRDDIAYFAVDLSPLEEPLVALGLEGVEFTDTRAAAARLPAGDAGTVAHGRSLVDWHNRHRYCPACGKPTDSRDGGSMRKCDACGAEHFPRTDPVVIMVAWRGDRCILGRQKAWAPGFYSALAGFIDQGETIEEAVRREVKEEVGLDVDEVQYRKSQPWPFPSSLMIGCFAHVTSEEEDVDPVELDGARWFTREEIRKAVFEPDPAKHGYGVPGSVAIAHHIIKDWCEQAG
ncbi:MAG TPA: NAD(+) diphosphatase [Dehalococcoidia bacterium]